MGDACSKVCEMISGRPPLERASLRGNVEASFGVELPESHMQMPQAPNAVTSSKGKGKGKAPPPSSKGKGKGADPNMITEAAQAGMPKIDPKELKDGKLNLAPTETRQANNLVPEKPDAAMLQGAMKKLNHTERKSASRIVPPEKPDAAMLAANSTTAGLASLRSTAATLRASSPPVPGGSPRIGRSYVARGLQSATRAVSNRAQSTSQGAMGKLKKAEVQEKTWLPTADDIAAERKVADDEADEF